MMASQQRLSCQSTASVKNTFINWGPQKDTNSIKRSNSWPLLAENEDQYPIPVLHHGVSDTIEEDLVSHAPSFGDLSGKISEMQDIDTTGPRDLGAVPTWRPRLPARPPHLRSRNSLNFRQADTPPTGSRPLDSCCRNRCIDGDFDASLSLSTRPSVSSTEATPSVLQSTSSTSMTHMSHGDNFSDGAAKTEGSDTLSTKNSGSLSSVATVASSLYVNGSHTPFLDAHATTAAVRNLDRHLTLSDFIATLDDNGFMGTYDFVNLPFRPRKKHSMGIAFINFLTPFHAQLFSDHSRYMGAVHGRKSRRLSIALSDVQGTELNIKRIEDSLKDKNRNEPLFPTVAFLHGKIVSFPLYYIPEV